MSNTLFVPNKVFLRGVLLHYFNMKKSAAESHLILVEVKFMMTMLYLSERVRRGSHRLRVVTLTWKTKSVPDVQKSLKTLNWRHYSMRIHVKRKKRLQLMRLSRALKEKRPQYVQRHDEVILQHDSARPHVAHAVKKYLETLKWEVLPHPPYSPDLAPSDYHLFRSMTHGLTEQHFRSYEDPKNGSIHGSHQNPHRFSEMVSANCPKDGRKQWSAMDNTLND